MNTSVVQTRRRSVATTHLKERVFSFFFSLVILLLVLFLPWFSVCFDTRAWITMAIQMNTPMDTNTNTSNRNIMPETHILGDESNLPAQFVAAKRISMKNYLDKPNEFRVIIQDHCIKKGKPLVVSDMNTLPGWDNDTFSLDQLKAYRGNESKHLEKITHIKKQSDSALLIFFCYRICTWLPWCCQERSRTG